MNDYERALIRYVVDGDIRNAQKQAKIILNKIATEKDRKFKEYQLKKLDNKGPELIELPYNLQKIIAAQDVTPSSVRVSVESTRANSKSLLLPWLTISMRSAKLTTTVFSLCVIVAAGLSMALAKTAKPLPLCRWREAIFSSSPSATLTVFALLLAGTRRSAVTDCKSMTTTSLSAKMVASRTSCLVTCSSSQRRSVPERSSARVSPKGRLFFYCHS